MRSTKVLAERLDGHREAAQRVLAMAQHAGREMDDGEFAVFNQHVADAKSAKAELELAELEREQIVTHSAWQHSGAERGMSNHYQPERVLPTNGRLPSEHNGRWTPNCSYRVGKLKVFTGPDGEREAWEAGHFLRAFVSHHWGTPDPVAHDFVSKRGWSVTNAAGEASGPAGGYLTPPQLSNRIVEVMERVGVAAQLFTKTPMTSEMLSIPKRSGGLTVFYPGEAGSITDSDKDWQQIQLIAKKRAVASLISSELIDDALINLTDNLFQEMGHSLALKQDQECIAGTGSSNYGGVVGLRSALGAGGIYTAATGDSTWSLLDLDDFTGAMALLPDKYHAAGPAFLCSSAFYFTTMLRIHAEAGGNTIASIAAGVGGARQFLGYPVFLSESMPTTTAVSTVSCLFGAFNFAAVLGERLGVRLARSDDYRFLNDQTTLARRCAMIFTFMKVAQVQHLARTWGSKLRPVNRYLWSISTRR